MVVVQWLRLCYAVLAHFDQLVFNVFQVDSSCFKFFKLIQVLQVGSSCLCCGVISLVQFLQSCFSLFQFVSICFRLFCIVKNLV